MSTIRGLMAVCLLVATSAMGSSVLAHGERHRGGGVEGVVTAVVGDALTVRTEEGPSRSR